MNIQRKVHILGSHYLSESIIITLIIFPSECLLLIKFKGFETI
jgi:hypothetical protein